MKTAVRRKHSLPGRTASLALACAAACLVGAAVAAAQGSGSVPPGGTIVPLTLHAPAPAPPDAGAINPGELERWVDGWLGSHLSAPGGAPGLVISVVQRNHVLLARGYGVADLATGAPVTGDTVFRVGSLSKPFTAAAAMQLVEAGRLDARQPVNRYLRDMQVSSAFGRPVTVLDLVTHTAGFDVRLEGTAAATDREVQPLGTYLRANLPPQVRRSGEILSYSNHGYALLGHVVEQVTGLPFERYVTEHVFVPLGMLHSSFRFTPDVQKRAAVGYERSGATGFRPSAPIHPHIYPAAGLNTTARDMAGFMIALLNGGRLGEARILSEVSAAEMQRQQFTQSPAMPGIAMGFFENVTRGERALVHGGGIRGFMSGVCLWPRQRLGLFVSNNGYSAALVQSFLAAFVEHYFRLTNGTDPARITTPPALEPFEGAYRAASTARGNLEKAGGLFGGDVEIRAVGGYRPHLDLGGDPFVPTGRFQFVLDRGEEPLAFGENGRGKVALLITVSPLLGCEVFEKLRWYETARVHRELLVLFCASFLSVVLAPLGGRLLQTVARPLGRQFRPNLPRPRGRGRWAHAVLFVITSLNLIFLLLMVVAFRLARDTGVLYGIPPLARFDLGLSAATALLALTLPFCLWKVWRQRYWSRTVRLHYTWCSVAAIAFIPFLRYWNLLGY